ncbi:DUF2142 domain-containing protein [Cryobacterium sp. TMT2-15-1]|uniref:DUF2142 domain-containing protein n=1 Tax=Cryobacterium sp. TMT2-15-1 TaxID=1259246 RepID=UPI00106C2C92|nr:DUF2142 domain-containing protein [Cryobacterium sp. TMT2-15-1]TFC55925.1 DUF2142 domain-containing protein [Cryobacterium sp. TMT2-15-1]
MISPAEDCNLERQTRGHGRSVFWTAFALMAMLATLWSMASPIFSVPDENAHAAKAIAQVRGDLTGHAVAGVRHSVVDLPEGYSYSQQIVCYLSHPEMTADCGFELGDEGGTDWFNTWVSAYNPIYYYLVGWPTLLLDGSAGIYAMRIISGLLCSVFVAWAFQTAMSVRRSRWLPFGLAFLAAPMVVYLFGAVNPNGIEVAAAGALWISLLRLLQHFDGRDAGVVSSLSRRHLWLIVTVASIVLATARATGPLWLVVVVGLCFAAMGWRAVKTLFTTASSYVGLAFVAAGGLFSILWTLAGGSLSGQADASDAPQVGASFVQGFAYVIRLTPDYFQQAIGFFGWIDTPLSVAAYWPFVAALAILVALAFAGLDRRSVATMGIVTGAALLVPALVQGYSVHQTGIIWQGRYGLFLYVGVTLVAAWLLSGRSGRRLAFLSTRLTWIGLTLLAAYGLAAFFLVLRRYGVGTDQSFSTIWESPGWEPPLGTIPLVALYGLVSLLFLLWSGRLAARTARADDEAEAEAEVEAYIDASASPESETETIRA